MDPQQVIDFWFGEPGSAAHGTRRREWFRKCPLFDDDIRRRFLPLYEAAAAGGLPHWDRDPRSLLALIILLDQFPRNIFRGGAHAFATDPLARAVARSALADGFADATDALMRPIFYLPFMHSEFLADQDLSLRLHEAFGDEDLLGYAVQHRDIIKRFGRFPHRNRALGRETTAAERAFLQAGGFAG